VASPQSTSIEEKTNRFIGFGIDVGKGPDGLKQDFARAL
jgi:hypothetical protein